MTQSPKPSPTPTTPTLASQVASVPVATVSQVQADLSNPEALGLLKLSSADATYAQTHLSPENLGEAVTVAAMANNNTVLQSAMSTGYSQPAVGISTNGIPTNAIKIDSVSLSSEFLSAGPNAPNTINSGYTEFVVGYTTSACTIRSITLAVSIDEDTNGTWVAVGQVSTPSTG